MDKESGDGGDSTAKPPPDPLLDPSSLFGAYWGRDGGASSAQAQAQAQAALFGFGSRYPAPSTLGVAANQAASLGLHPAASAAWWSMASHLAAQDYLARLQASGLNFPQLGDPYAALSALSGSSMKQPKQPKQPSRNERSGRSSVSSMPPKDKSPSTSTNSQHSMADWASTYGFPKTSSPSTMASQSLSSLASLNNLAQQPHHSKPVSKQSHQPQPPRKSSSGKEKERDMSVLRSELMLAQAAAQGAYHAAVAAAAKGKNLPMYPFSMGSEKDRRGGIDSLTGLPHNLLSAALEGGDPAAVLGGVRLPPDTEIIKYTSSLTGPKVPTSSTNRGRKKTISLDPPHVSLHPSSELPSKRQKLDEYGNSRSSVEVIRLPNKPDRGSSISGTPPPNLSDYAGISRELLQTIASQSGVSLAALEKQLAGTNAADSGLNLSTKSNASSEEIPLDLGSKPDDDAPLNLSLKPTPANTQASDALSRLTSLSSSLNASNDRISRRKPGAKPRRVAPELVPQGDIARPRSSGSEDSESVSQWPSREGRPRNLGRGVSKPKKNTVASLLAQSRALGLRPALAHQLLGETDLEKLRALVGEGGSTDSECRSDSHSDSDASDAGVAAGGTPAAGPQLRLPLALGWKRVTVIKGLSRNCHIKGDVSYGPPPPHEHVTITSHSQLVNFLESNPCPPLSVDNFSFNSRCVLGEYTQPGSDVDPVLLSETDVSKRLEEAKALAALAGPRSTPPLERRIELARRQQAARDARRDASARNRDQVRLVRELERSEKAEYVKREKEVRSQQILEHINRNRSQLTIEAVPVRNEWKVPEALTKPKDRTMPQISLSLIPVSGKDAPIKTLNYEQGTWTQEYNALDKMKDFAEKAAFDLPKAKADKNYDFSLTKAAEKAQKIPEGENNLEKLIESYSRISEFINGCDWSKLVNEKKVDDAKALEQKYLDAKNEFMTQNLMLMPKDNKKSVLREVIDLSTEDENILSEINRKISQGMLRIGKDGALSITVQTVGDLSPAKRKKQEEVDKQKNEDHAKRQQEREIKRHQAMLLKEQQKYITEERERRRQHTTFIRQLDSRRRWEERERRKHQNLLDRLLVKEKKLQQRRKEMELLAELRRPQEDSTLSDQKPLPTLERIPGLKLAGQAFADLLQTFEFLHNFGNSLGFVVDSLPSLDTLQQGLLPDYNNEAEDELVLLTIRLLEIALEDPGIPHPGRHTTLLGQAIRIGDITPDNLSEVLRIYLYANATGQVKALTGLTVERERERRVADHHQSDAEMQQSCMSSKNAPYYQHLHSNATYKLSETLRDKPFVSLNPTSKARILATLCDELLQNKSVLRQIDASLDHLNHLRKEKYLMDAKFRKLRVLYTRKTRSEHSEKQQALALERMQRLVEESVVTRSPLHESSDKSQTPKKESSPEKPNTPSPYKDSEDQSDKELSPLKDLSNSMKSKEMLNNNKDECPVEGKDKDSVMGDNDGNFSDLESEGTQPEEDEDKNLSSEEVGRKVERFSRQCEQHSLQLAAASTSLRAACSLQDRYWRRYWSLGKAGGIWVEAMESAQPEILSYHARLEDMKLNAGVKQEVKEEIGELKVKMEDVDSTRVDAEADALELRSIKNELNLSDRTQIIKYEPNNSACKVEGSIKMEEKYIQHKQNNEECDMLDIEDSIPTAFLVQKPHKPVPANEEEPKETKTEPVEEQEDPKDNLVNNLEELRKMAEAVSSQLVAAKKAEEQKDVKPKTEEMDTEDAHVHLYTKMLDGKWFSILRHEIGLTSINENEDVPKYCDNDKTCAEIVLSQGHRWDVSNNLHLLNDPSLFTLNSMVTSVQVPNNNIYPDSSLTMSGLDQDMIDNVSHETEFEVEKEKDQENDLEKELQADSKADLSAQKAKGLNSLGLLNFNALSTYVTCDSPPPIAMSLEELDQLDYCKVHGLPKKIEGNYVPKDLRHGWWRITDPEQVPALLSALHSRGVRERELYASLMSHLPTYNGALYVDKGDTGRTQLTVTAADQELCPASYPDPDEPGSFSAEAARRVDLRLAAMVDALEERVSAASMQVKGWRPSHSPPPPGASGADIVERARQKLAQLEAHVERRYLKPPLVQSTNEANLGAMLQGEHGASSGNSPQNSDSGEGRESKGIARGLSTWREAVSRCNTAAQLAMLLRALETHIAWDKSCMKANCQFCLCGDNEDQLLLCDGCDKGYHTYCFKPRMEKIPEGDWYCWECVNKARGERVCIVCGGGSSVTRLVPCALCCRAYHPACHYPPLAKNPRGKWYCAHCINRAPPKKPRKSNKRDSKNKDSIDLDSSMVPSPAASHASTSTTASECPGAQNIPDKEQDKLDEPLTEPLTEQENGHTAALELAERDESASEKCRRVQYVTGNGAVPHLEAEHEVEDHEAENVPLLARVKKDKPSAKRQGKDMLFCKNLLGEMECHEHAWPFLVPVNTKQFPQYRKVIKSPMDLSTIKRKLQDSSYKCKEEFAQDVRLIFSNCEEFNEDYSPVGRAGHTMRQFFELKWNQTEQ
ncbi:bromodomain adjacent to zinc finger domain protein 2B-like isoform X3 [Leptidea sinapis]|uniref:bromodomain adjacent to zinc finger domain protein 2B-like isoform X3 n=1 Tax=Leptidea sinapis TaxID=189913 RepID=UPI0021C4BCC1|nr:bromodomain adjacent to zinc finger domain protein 2B-like isoform X3 [Leptidea sinapis]